MVLLVVGAIMLVGIAVNNGIVMVDYTNQLRYRGLGVLEATQEGAARGGPVLRTVYELTLVPGPDEVQ